MANITVVRLDMQCSKCKKVALQSVTKIEGIDKLEIDMTKKQMTIIGDADPVCVANQLRRKFRCAEIVFAGPVPPPPPPPPKEKKEEKKEKKEDKKEAKKEEKTEEKKEEKIEIKVEEKKEEVKVEETKKEEKSEKKVEEKPPEPTPAPAPQEAKPAPAPQEAAPAPQPVIIHEGNKVEHHMHCRCVGPYEPGYYQPCAYCSNRPEILWPTYNPPRAPNEVWYVWSEEKQQDPCTIS